MRANFAGALQVFTSLSVEVMFIWSFIILIWFQYTEKFYNHLGL